MRPAGTNAAGWSERGHLDELGHKLGLDLARHIDDELDIMVERIATLLNSGWSRVQVVTDHGWLLLPGGLPKVALPPSLTATKWARCATVRGESQPEVPVLPWYWNPEVRIACPPGIGSFIAGAVYAHGGVSLQECVIPELTVERGAEVARATITDIQWRGMRLRVRASASVPGITVDLRTNAKQPGSSLVASAKNLDANGEASLVVSDDKHEGAAAVIVVLDAQQQHSGPQADDGRRTLMSIALDALDTKAASVYDGYLVRKDLVRRYARQYPVPTYVVEFLLGRYCASTDEKEIAEGLEIVEKQLKDRTVRTGDQEIFKARARDTGPVKLIDLVKARLDTRNDCYDAELPSLGLRDVRIADNLVREHERMLTDGFYAEVTLSYDAIIAQQQGGRPFAIDAIRPIQMSKSDVLDVYERGRQSFTTDEWIDFLLRSIGLEPSRSQRAGQARGPSAHGSVRRTELQPRGARASRDGQEPSVSADLPVRAPDLRRQGDRRQDVRKQRHWPARPCLPVRRRVLRRGVRHLLRSEGRREHHEGLHGVGPVQPRQGSDPR